MFRAAALSSALTCAAASGCSNGGLAIPVELGPFSYTVNASRVEVGPAWRDPSSNTLRSLACTAPRDCPAFELGEPPPDVACVASLCDPGPVSWSLTSDVIDLSRADSLQGIAQAIGSARIHGASFMATAGGLRTPVGPTQLYWGPETAPTIDSSGVFLLGEVPVLSLGEGRTQSGSVTLDEAGAQALSTHLLRVSRRFRVFARPQVDLAPGDPLPSGSVVLQLRLEVSVEPALPR